MAVPNGRCIVSGEEVCISFPVFPFNLVVVTLILMHNPYRRSAGPLCVCVLGQLAGFYLCASGSLDGVLSFTFPVFVGFVFCFCFLVLVCLLRTVSML